jgi:hypothetical protein
MSDQLPETWSRRELPILRAALLRLEAGADYADLDEVRNELGLTATDMRQAVEGLATASPPYIDAELHNGWDGTRSPGSIDTVLERGRRELGTWPTPERLVDEIARALETAAAETAEPEQRSRLQAAAGALTGFARDVAVAVVAKHVGG